MYEFEVLLKNGEHTFIWVTALMTPNAAIQKRRTKSKPFYSKNTLIKEMTSRNPGGFSNAPAGRARTPRPVFRVNRQFAQFSIRIFGEFDERNFPKIP